MKTISLLLMSIIFLTTINSCNQSSKDSNNELNDSVAEISIPEVKTGSFYAPDIDKGNAIILADTIIYDVELKNNDVDNEWKEECLKYVNRKAITNIIFNAIYNGKLDAYNYNDEITPITIDDLKALEKEYSRDRITKMQFKEEWFFDEENLVFGKKVIAIMLAYEVYDAGGKVRGHTAGLVVYLNKSENEVSEIQEAL